MAEAQFDYAVTLLRGLGLTRDEPKAIPYLKAAAQKGLATAQNRLAHAYAEGVGVKKSAVDAAKWRLIAQSSGLKDAMLDTLVGKLPKEQRLAAQKAASEWRAQAGLF
jgi:TPR repeat protein